MIKLSLLSSGINYSQSITQFISINNFTCSHEYKYGSACFTYSSKEISAALCVTCGFFRQGVGYFLLLLPFLVPLQLLLRNGKVVRFKSSLHDNISA